ncbi:MAG: hypothetical protein SOZ59_09995 [Candidatus Limivivens sp.]|nr:hypothetical protein [Candidatus Limivivens sp.]
MSSNVHSKSRLFLLELLLAILIFAVSGTVCIRIFAKAYTVSRDTKALNGAVNLAESAAAMLNAAEADRTAGFSDGSACFYLLQEYSSGELSEEGFLAWFDENFRCCDKETAVYQLSIDLPPASGGFLQNTIRITRIRDDKTFYTLNHLHHVPNTL